MCAGLRCKVQSIRACCQAFCRDYGTPGQLRCPLRQTTVEFVQQFCGCSVKAVFRPAQFAHHDGQIAEFFPERLHRALKLFGVGFQLFRCKAVALTLMP